MSDKVVKSRYWCFVGYPESLPDDWVDILRKVGVPVAVSPLHEFDTEPTGDLKKPHYHFLICYPGPTTYNNVKNVTDSLNATRPERVSSVKGNYRYFTHRDNPDKFQYSEKDILHLNGFCPIDFFSLTSSEEDKFYTEIALLIRDKKINQFSDLVYFLLDNGFVDYYSFICRHSMFFNYLLRSRSNICFLYGGKSGAGEP